jgi:hypothetical protein
VTQDYLIGELSACLQQLEAATARESVADVVRLRHRVEASPPSDLPLAAARALDVADGICWDSLAFVRQAQASAELRQFGICARLIADI